MKQASKADYMTMNEIKELDVREDYGSGLLEYMVLKTKIMFLIQINVVVGYTICGRAAESSLSATYECGFYLRLPATPPVQPKN